MVVASQLVGKVSIEGVGQSQKDLLNMDTANKKAQESLNKLQSTAKDASAILASRFTSDLKSAQGGLQNLSQRAEDAGLDVSKFAQLQQKASEAAAKLGLAQAQAADATAKANAVTNDASASAEKIALAQARAAVSAENVQKAEMAASDAMAMMQGEATRLADALDVDADASTLFSKALEVAKGMLGGMAEGANTAISSVGNLAKGAVEAGGSIFSGFGHAIGGVLDFGRNLGITIFGFQQDYQLLSGAITSIIGPAEQYQQVQKQTNDVLESTKSVAGMSAQAIADLASSLGKTTFYGRDAVQSGENLLLTFTNIGKDVFPRTTKVMLDMSKAMGQDIKSSAVQMGKALNDPTQGFSALTRVGVTFTEQQKEQIKTMQAAGNVAGAQKIILGELEREFGGSANATKSFAGQWQILKNQADDFREEIGTALMPMLSNLMSGVSANVMPALEKFGTWFTNVGAPALQKFASGAGQQIANVFQLISSIINNDVIPIVKMFVNGWEEAISEFDANEVQSTFQDISQSVQKFKATVDPLIVPFFNNLNNLFILAAKFGAGLATTFSDLIPPLTDIGGQIGLGVAEVMGSIFRAAGILLPKINDLADAFEPVRKAFVTFIDKSGIVKTAFDLLKDSISVLTDILGSTLDKFTQLVNFMNSSTLPAQILRDAIAGIAVAIVSIKIASFVSALPGLIALLPPLIAGFGGWAVSAGAAAVATIAATWPILAIGAAIALVVGGIILAVQHWGDIMGWITGKTEQTRIKVEQDHVKMRIAQDENTAQGAQAAINNYEKERQGILQKLKETHDPAEQAELQHQLKMTTAQEQGQMARLQKAEADKKKQLAKQKELHDEMVEAQKPWYQRMWDSITTFFGNVGHWFTDRFNDAKNGISGVFGSIGRWFGDRWHDIQNIFGGVGQWFHDRFEDAKNKIISVFYPIAKWFIERWNEIYAPIKPVVDYIGSVFETIGIIVHAIFGKLGAWFHDRFMEIAAVFVGIGIFFHDRFTEAWNAVVGVFQFLGKWFGDRWHEVQGVFAFVGSWFHDRWNDAWNAIVAVFTPIGKWFSDRWVDVQNIFRPVGNWFHDRFQEAWNGITAFFAPIGKWFSDRWNEVMGGVNTFKKSVSDKFSEIKTDVTNIFRGMINGIIDQLNNGINAFAGFLNFFGEKLNKLAESLGTHGTIPMVAFKPIPHYAKGTDAHPGGAMIVGEEGPELMWAPSGTKVATHKETMQILAMMGGKIPGYAEGVGDLGSQIMNWISGGAKNILDNLINMFNIKAPNILGMGNIASGIFNKVKGWALGFIDKLLPKFDFGGASVPGNLQQWIAAGMSLAHAPGNWAGALAQIAMHESGGNPRAINNWDINAQRGDPSRGLFQTIGATFRAYALPGHLDIYNPIDNTAAAIGYIRSRYGDVFHVPGIMALAAGKPYVGYANGGVISEPIAGVGLNTGTRYAFGERGKELVTPYVPSGVSLSLQTSTAKAPVIHIHNYIDGKEITDHTANRMIRSARASGPIRSNT